MFYVSLILQTEKGRQFNHSQRSDRLRQWRWNKRIRTCCIWTSLFILYRIIQFSIINLTFDLHSTSWYKTGIVPLLWQGCLIEMRWKTSWSSFWFDFEEVTTFRTLLIVCNIYCYIIHNKRWIGWWFDLHNKWYIWHHKWKTCKNLFYLPSYGSRKNIQL